jgi:hypothetical protein
MRPLVWIGLVAPVLVHTGTVDADPLYCSTWQQITTCSSPDGCEPRVAVAGRHQRGRQPGQPLDDQPLARHHHHHGHAARALTLAGRALFPAPTASMTAFRGLPGRMTPADPSRPSWGRSGRICGGICGARSGSAERVSVELRAGQAALAGVMRRSGRERR